MIDLFTDKSWRLNNLYTIVDKNGDEVIFRQNALQKIVSSNPAKRKMILKARQFGFSTNEIIDMFDDIMFGENLTYAILAHEQDSIKKLFRIVQRAYHFLPDPLKPSLDRGGGSKYEYYFPEKNCRIYCDLESRSDTLQRLHISEAAFMKDSSRVKSTLQALPLNGKVTIETTANGMSNHFYDMWIDPDQPYEKLFFPWFMFDAYRMPSSENITLALDEIDLCKKARKMFHINIDNEQIMFRRFKKAELKASTHDKTRVSFEQEYPEDDVTCFLVSGEAIMDLIKIKKMIDECLPPLSDSNGTKIYKLPDKTKTYAIGADVAEGIRKDFSVAVVIEIETKEVVAKVRGQWKPSEFADKLFEIGKQYASPQKGFPILAVERNNHGHAVLLKLDETLGYPSLYINPKDERLGWYTTSITRPIMMNAFLDFIEDGTLIVRDREILTECLTLLDMAGKIEAAVGKHDDCIIATAIAIQVVLANSISLYDNIENRILI